MASLREYVIQPQKCNDRFEESRRENSGDPNNFTKNFQHEKNRKSKIKASKAKHEENNQSRMRKHHGTVAKKEAQHKCRTSTKGAAVEAGASEQRRVKNSTRIFAMEKWTLTKPASTVSSFVYTTRRDSS
eukprot:scaffold426_cov219-Amphora_coffeaeformis.AAC.68